MRTLASLLKKNNNKSNSFDDDLENQDGSGLKGLLNLYSPEGDSNDRRDIADELYDANRLTAEQLDKVRQQQREKPGADLAALLKHLRFVKDDDILFGRAKIYGYEFIEINHEQVDRNAYTKLDKAYIKTNRIVPLYFKDDGKILVLATSEPGNVFIIDEAKRKVKAETQIVVCSDKTIDDICQAMEASSLDYNVDEIINDMDEVEIVNDETQESEDLEKMAGESPVIKFVNYLISNALHESASDIHLEPREKTAKIRYRIDGVLFEMMQCPAKMHPAVVSRLKIMANLDISERRLPQDGKIAVKVAGRSIDLRVSTLPISHGEKVVIRILDKKSIMSGLDNSGMNPEIRAEFERQISQPHGIILVTGPTGSGKSTTLYSALNQLDGDKMNISTVEDPVEYELGFCNQVQTKEHIGMTFAAALRSLLRQDPDIIMVGEIRDSETARIAVQAALTGHLVLSTLHTNDAPSSITRLVNIGVDAYLIAASLNGILAQRLVRKICENCKEKYILPDNLKKYIDETGIDINQIYKGKGCEKCRNSGYSGRTGVYEFLTIDDRFKRLINQDHSVSAMQKAFLDGGGRTLFQDGIAKVQQGITTLEEILRVTQAGEIAVGDDVLNDKINKIEPQNNENSNVFEIQPEKDVDNSIITGDNIPSMESFEQNQ